MEINNQDSIELIIELMNINERLSVIKERRDSNMITLIRAQVDYNNQKYKHSLSAFFLTKSQRNKLAADLDLKNRAFKHDMEEVNVDYCSDLNKILEKKRLIIDQLSTRQIPLAEIA